MGGDLGETRRRRELRLCFRVGRFVEGVLEVVVAGNCDVVVEKSWSGWVTCVRWEIVWARPVWWGLRSMSLSFSDGGCLKDLYRPIHMFRSAAVSAYGSIVSAILRTQSLELSPRTQLNAGPLKYCSNTILQSNLLPVPSLHRFCKYTKICLAISSIPSSSPRMYFAGAKRQCAVQFFVQNQFLRFTPVAQGPYV